jgi:hypothetical protein
LSLNTKPAFPFKNARQHRRYPGDIDAGASGADRDARSDLMAPRQTSPAAEEYLYINRW